MERLCDDTFSLYVRVRDLNRCRLCGADGRHRVATQCAHLISRTYAQCRILGENAWCLCSACHRRYTSRPLEWDALVEAAVGVVEWSRRKSLAQVTTRLDYSSARLPLLYVLREEVRTKTACGLDEQLAKIEARHATFEGRVRDGLVRQA